MAVKKTKPAASAAKSVSKAKSAENSSKKPAAKSKATDAKSVKTPAKSTAKAAAPAKKRAPAAKKTAAKTRTPAAQSKKRGSKAEPESAHRIDEPVLDPIGDVTSGEGRTYMGESELHPLKGQDKPAQVESQIELDEFLKETHIEASDADLESGPGLQAAQTAKVARARDKARDKARASTRQVEADSPTAEIDEDEEVEPSELSRESSREPGKLERLQKILSQAGVASRRTAEEMIAAGRVMVNGKVVTQLGSKADPARDHIRVDGKLLHGAERHRYFMLNKPRGYVTTVSDPEGRPTVMEFFASSRERVYPVGRLDYLSEGLLLMTNDGELANLLTKAGSGVEKTYLVKVAGQPSADQIERLRAGVAIEKGEQGSERVRTAPARIRPFREGDNPWFEVTLIEGRNRELRKMFSAIGHFAEKIRRVGYGPLVLDLEPGKMRELAEEEVNALRLTAEGKMKPRRPKTGQMLPKEAGVPAEQRAEKRSGKSFGRPPRREFDRGPQRGATSREGSFDRRPPRPEAGGERPRWQQQDRGAKREWQPRDREFRGGQRGGGDFRGNRPPRFGGGPRRENAGNREGGAARGGFQPRAEGEGFRSPKPFARERSGFEERKPKPFQQRGEQSESRGGFRGGQRPRFGGGPRREGGRDFGGAPRREGGENRFGGTSRPPFKPRGERPQWKQDGEAKPRREFGERGESRSRFEGQRGTGFKRGGDSRGGNAKPAFGRKPGFGGKPGGPRKFGGQGGGAKRGFSRPGSQRGGWKRG